MASVTEWLQKIFTWYRSHIGCESLRLRSCYFLPPFSLLFNIAMNPALSSANTALHAPSVAGTLMWLRLIVNLQPVCQHFEAWLAPRARRLIRRNTLPRLKGKTDGEDGDLNPLLFLSGSWHGRRSSGSQHGRRRASWTRCPRRTEGEAIDSVCLSASIVNVPCCFILALDERRRAE